MAKPHFSPTKFEKEVERKQITTIIGFDGCDAHNELDKYAMSAMSTILSGVGGLSGWLPVELRGKRNLVYIVWASNISNLYGGKFTINTQCEPGDLDTVKNVIMSLVDKLKAGDFTEDELNTITKAMAEQFVMSRQDQSGLVSSAGLDELYGFGFDYSDKFPEKIVMVKKDDVVRVANKYLQNPTAVLLKPKQAQQQMPDK